MLTRKSSPAMGSNESRLYLQVTSAVYLINHRTSTRQMRCQVNHRVTNPGPQIRTTTSMHYEDCPVNAKVGSSICSPEVRQLYLKLSERLSKIREWPLFCFCQYSVKLCVYYSESRYINRLFTVSYFFHNIVRIERLPVRAAILVSFPQGHEQISPQPRWPPMHNAKRSISTFLLKNSGL